VTDTTGDDVLSGTSGHDVIERPFSPGSARARYDPPDTEVPTCPIDVG
jgi:hypothetical protein